MNYSDVDKILKSEGLNRASDINSLKKKCYPQRIIRG